MARRLFFVDQVRDGAAVLSGESARHLALVLRGEEGQQYEISDNQNLYLAEIAAAANDRVVFRVLEKLPSREPRVHMVLLVSLIKFDRFEWIVEKATELGVNAIVPVEAERSEKGLLKAAAKRLERWRKIARESSQQSRRVRAPEMEPPLSLDAALTGHDAAVKYFLEEKPGAIGLLQALPSPAPASVALLVGPEGGWTDRERARLTGDGWMSVSLGATILRAETAAIAALAIIRSMGDL